MDKFEIEGFNNTHSGEHKPGIRWITTAIVCVVCLVVGGVGGAFISDKVSIASPEATLSPSATIENTPFITPGIVPTPSIDSSDKVFTQEINKDALSPSAIYEKSISSIVGIVTEGTTTNIFGYQSEFAATGTGFVVGSEGYIVTNYHVVENGNKFSVSFHDSTSYDASLIGFDESNDIALLKIEGDSFNEIAVGNSDELTVGQDVVVIGNPLGELTYTMTRGILSALDRKINITGTPISMFQIDAAVNSGNSGGPVIDAAGNVIGVVAARPNKSGVDGIGFCIPINDVKKIVSDIMEYGYVTGKPYMGIAGFTVTSQMSRYYGIPEGCFVQAVYEASSAEAAGIEVGDVITGLDSNKIKSYETLKMLIGEKSVGDKVSVTFVRNNVEMTVTVVVGERTSSNNSGNDGEAQV